MTAIPMGEALFGTDGIRGIAGRGALAPERVAALGRAIGRLLRDRPESLGAPPGSRARRVLLGRDTRLSGPSLAAAIAAGLAIEGIAVEDLGILPTPGVARLSAASGADLAVVVSASHNPPDFNGVKLLAGAGTKLPERAERAVEAALDSLPPAADGAVPAAISVRRNAARRYAAWLRQRLPGVSPLRGLRIAVDCGDGAASRIAPALLRSLGAAVAALSARGRGEAINAGSGALHPERVARAVARRGLSLGIALDGDADRALFADPSGTVRDGDDVLAILAPEHRAAGRLPADAVVGTPMTNLGLEAFFRGLGIRLERAPVGDRYVFERMVETGAALGGEPSGHIVFLPDHTTGDGLFTALMLLEAIVRTGRSLADLATGWKRFPQAIVNIPVREKPPLDGIPSVQAAIDAARAALGDRGRLLVRYSGTEPLARVMVEGEDAQGVASLANGIADAIRLNLAPAEPPA